MDKTIYKRVEPYQIMDTETLRLSYEEATPFLTLLKFCHLIQSLTDQIWTGATNHRISDSQNVYARPLDQNNISYQKSVFVSMPVWWCKNKSVVTLVLIGHTKWTQFLVLIFFLGIFVAIYN